MRFGHTVLAVSLIWGILLQGFLSGLPFDLRTLFFIALNLTVPFGLLYHVQAPSVIAVALKPIKVSGLLLVVGLLFCVYPAIQIVGHLTERWAANPLEQLPIHASIPLFIGFVILAPLIEELFFRGYLLSAYENKGIAKSGLWVSLWFALYHLNLHQGIYTFLFSLVLVGLMQSKQNIIYPILLHAGVNALSYFSSFPSAMGEKSILQIMSVSGWSALFQGLYLSIIAFALYLLFFKDRKEKQHSPLRKLKWDLSLSIVVLVFIWSVVGAWV